MAPGNQEATSPRFQQGLIPGFQDFLRTGHQELLRSGLYDLWSSRVKELMILGHQGFLTSGDQDAKTSIRIDFLASLFHDGLSPRFIRPISAQFCSRCRLSPRNIICFGTRQAVFSVTRNRFRNRKQLARKGMENSSEVVVFYRGHRGPTRNLAGEGFSRHLLQKTGKIRPFLAWESGGLSLQSDIETTRFRSIFGG